MQCLFNIFFLHSNIFFGNGSWDTQLTTYGQQPTSYLQVTFSWLLKGKIKCTKVTGDSNDSIYLINAIYGCTLKSDSHLPKKKIICCKESPLTMMSHVFYLILKALFILKIFTFLSCLIDQIKKTAWLER